ncbi:hypothetical protein E2562_001402 [Oryza meyeriana var. granulata]|uniref:Uncharacterized protein n=1 Tax=Oryza meyeriana var. granulata TaxID=110450 RepID=A0A6G1DD61_9ORYZ|nr:hypothetical protein E2562_001402 [Oryza meyeriana var. granulata]
MTVPMILINIFKDICLKEANQFIVTKEKEEIDDDMEQDDVLLHKDIIWNIYRIVLESFM